MALYKLLDNIFYMLNNLDIRHLNTDKNDNEHAFKPITLELKESGKLEEYYDDLYQMILLANLETEQIHRNKKIKKLRNGLKK